MTSNDNDVVEKCLFLGVLDRLSEVLEKYSQENLKKEVCWGVSNISASSASQIQRLIKHKIFE